MRISRTSLAGATAGACIAIAQIPGLHRHLVLAAELAAAVAITYLGRHARDCPANCSGTDADGHPRDTIRIPVRYVIFLAGAIALISCFAGCVIPNPDPAAVAAGAPAYLVSPALGAASNNAAAAATAAGQITGTGPLLPAATTVVFGAVGALSLLWARHKSQVAAALAAAVAAGGRPAVATALSAAEADPKLAALHALLHDALHKRLTPPIPPV